MINNLDAFLGMGFVGGGIAFIWQLSKIAEKQEKNEPKIIL